MRKPRLGKSGSFPRAAEQPKPLPRDCELSSDQLPCPCCVISTASMYSEIQRERADIGGLMARPEYREWNPELIKPKKLLNPVKASRSHQEMHRELLMNHRRWERSAAV